jgi:phage FluMu protein Com
MDNRFQDAGETVWSFVDDILVRCPSCAGPAHVIPRGAISSGIARLTCMSCGLAKQTPKDSETPRRCQHCNRWIPSADWKTVRRTARSRYDQVECPRCHRLARSTSHWISVGAPEDPFFGLPVFLQVPCCDEVLWAFNSRHLEVLGALVGASVREREREARARGEVVSNSTLLAKLPRWMKVAKNRDAVVSCIDKLRERARTSPGRDRGASSRRSLA